MFPLTSRSPNGVTNAAPWQTFGSSGVPDPTWAQMDVDDFNAFVAATWTTTLVGTGAVAAAAGKGGLATFATTAGATDATYNQRPVASFVATLGKRTFFKFAGSLSEIGSDVFYAGLIATSTTPLAAADGIYLTKVAGAALLSLVHKIGGVTTTVALPTSIVLTAATAFELGIYISDLGSIHAFFNPTTGINPIAAASGASRGYVAVIPVSAAGVTQVALAPSFGLVNASAVARTLTVDYVVAATER